MIEKYPWRDPGCRECQDCGDEGCMSCELAYVRAENRRLRALVERGRFFMGQTQPWWIIEEFGKDCCKEMEKWEKK